MKDRVDKSRGIIALIGEGLAKVKPTDSLWLPKETVRRKRNWSDSNCPDNALASRWAWKKRKRKNSSYKRPEVFTATGMNTIGSDPRKVGGMEYFLSDRIFQSVDRLRRVIGGNSVSFPLVRWASSGHASSWHPESAGEEEDGCLLLFHSNDVTILVSSRLG